MKKMWKNWRNGNHHARWPDGPMARPSVLPALTWAKILDRHHSALAWHNAFFWRQEFEMFQQSITESCWSMLKILMVFHVEKRIPMLIVECRDSCQSWQWRLSFRTLIRLGPLWWTNSHWENLAPWLAPVCHRHPYTAPVHSTRTRHPYTAFTAVNKTKAIRHSPTLMFRLCLAFCCRKSLYISNLRSISLYEYSAYKNLVRWSLSSP